MWSHVHAAFRVISLLLQDPGDRTQVDRIVGKVLYPWAISSAQVRILLRTLCYSEASGYTETLWPIRNKKVTSHEDSTLPFVLVLTWVATLCVNNFVSGMFTQEYNFSSVWGKKTSTHFNACLVQRVEMGGNGFQWRGVSWQARKGCSKVSVPGRPFQVSINCQQSSSFPCEVWGNALGGSCMCINFGRDGEREPALLGWQICFSFSQEPSQCQLKYLQGGSNSWRSSTSMGRRTYYSL